MNRPTGREKCFFDNINYYYYENQPHKPKLGKSEYVINNFIHLSAEFPRSNSRKQFL